MAPALALDEPHVEEQERGCQRQVVDEVTQVNDAALDALEATAGADVAQDAAHRFAKEVGDRARAHQVEDASQQNREDQCDDLAVSQRRNEKADGGIGRAQQQRCQIAANHRAPVQIAQQRHGDRQRQRQRQRQRHHAHHGQEFAHHKLPGLYGQRHQHLKRAAALLFAPLAHGQRRHEEDQQKRHPLEERAHVGDAAGKEGVHPEEDKEGGPHKRAQKDERKG